ncbi:MAG: aminotransferase class IV family protein [Saprospiraceae bacterium]|nr:aminotransferase class IV family protein [Saprospiraceae bacterium]
MFNLNAQLIKELPEGLWLAQRGLFYADSLFETIRVFEGKIPLMAAHWERLSRGLSQMGYALPSFWSAVFFEQEILRVAPPNARVRLSVWRAPGGLYLPENNEPQFLIAVQPLESGMYEWPDEGLQVGFCQSVRLPIDAWSGWKTLNAARYVAAAQEARIRGWDDAVLLNAHERVCEATSSNIFWVERDGTLCTTPLADGCVTGVLRDLLLALTKASGLAIIEKSANCDAILEAREVFFTNAARGIRWVRTCEGTAYRHEQTRRLHELMAAHLQGKMSV